jgi:phosphate transport system protein
MSTPISSSVPHFLEDLSALKRELMAEGKLVAERVSTAIHGLSEQDYDCLDEVAMGDADVNAMQVAIDDHAFKLLALHQPVARDLRLIVAAIKINSDLERVGDIAVNIAESALHYYSVGRLSEQQLLLRMSTIAETMLENALQSFVSDNLGIAQAVLERDDALDSLRAQSYRRLVGIMTDDRKSVASALELMLMTRYMERIGDHATNIAEDVFFVVAGEDVRHET